MSITYSQSMFMFNDQYFDVNVTYLSIFNNDVV